jgi:parallel beta-helix repeat protein
MKKLSLIAVLVITILLSSFTMAATYYVDRVNGRDSNSGTSTSSPWKTIAKVNSFTFKPGDNILFRRGIIWYEQLTVKQSGTSSAAITFGAYGSGSAPVIDGSQSRLHGVYMKGRAYIVIRDLKIQNTKHGAVRVDASKYITVRDNEMYVNSRAGVFIQESNNCLIRGNRMTTPATEFNVQTDGIYAQRNSFNTYDGNNIVISNRHKDQHCDAIQFFQETSATVKNNYVEQNNSKGGNAQGIYCSENHGTFRIFNNIGYGMSTTSSLIKFTNSSSTYTGRAEIIGNTLYGGRGALVQSNDPNLIFKNNIIVTTGSLPLVSFARTLSSTSNINNNLYKRSGSGSTVVVYKGSGYTISKWRSAGFDRSGMEADPRFVSISSKDFKLTSSSPALNKGVNLSSPFNIDRVGTKRPYGNQSDIGAFEMKILAKGGNDNEPLETEITEELTEDLTPEVFALAQNYPNPFNPTTTINYSLPENSDVSLKVYDITGSEVVELVNTAQNAGNHQVNFNASNLASGTYIYILRAKDFVQTKKMILLK